MTWCAVQCSAMWIGYAFFCHGREREREEELSALPSCLLAYTSFSYGVLGPAWPRDLVCTPITHRSCERPIIRHSKFVRVCCQKRKRVCCVLAWHGMIWHSTEGTRLVNNHQQQGLAWLACTTNYHETNEVVLTTCNAVPYSSNNNYKPFLVVVVGWATSSNPSKEIRKGYY